MWVKDGSKVFLAQRKPQADLGALWEFPGGKLDPGESFEDCMIREFNEEFEIQVEKVEFFMDTRFENTERIIELKVFKIFTSDQGPKVLNDHLKFEWVSPTDLLSYQLLPADIPIAEEVLRRWDELI